MIIYSIVPTEQIFQMEHKPLEDQGRIVELNNIKAEVKLVEEDIYEVKRIYSTDVRDYLKPEFQPGTRIKMRFEVDSHFLYKNRW